MLFREATVRDLPSISRVRFSVIENVLEDPSSITDEDVKRNLTTDGKGWVCEINGRVEAFVIVNVSNSNVWALFVTPDHERKGIGRTLQLTMLDWCFEQLQERLWLSTSPGTRAEGFYEASGWQKVGSNPMAKCGLKCHTKHGQERVRCGRQAIPAQRRVLPILYGIANALRFECKVTKMERGLLAHRNDIRSAASHIVVEWHFGNLKVRSRSDS